MQRPRMYTIEQPSSLQDDMLRSHYSTKPTKTRSIADGQSQNSFSNNSGRYPLSPAFTSNLAASRQGKTYFSKPINVLIDFCRTPSIKTIVSNAIGPNVASITRTTTSWSHTLSHIFDETFSSQISLQGPS